MERKMTGKQRIAAMLVAALALFPVLALPLPAVAVDDCMWIEDNDMRRLCRSQTSERDECWMIRDRDTRWLCRAQRGESGCGQIEDRDMREYCRSTAPKQ